MAISCYPRVAGAVLGFVPLTRLTAEDIPLLEKLSACVNAMDPEQLNQLSNTLEIVLSESAQQNPQEAKQEITNHFLESNSDQLEGYAAGMPDC
ncbi:MAG TPA: hypothetical protein VED46_08045 [Alphaproteobacteria bacterium]|nr:hypothetical protein [Alphaproteobacteria bacterium]